MIVKKQFATEIISDLNSLHPDIKMSGTISDQSVNYLDLVVFKGPRFDKERKLDLKVYSKPENQYLYFPFTSHFRANKAGFIVGELTRYVRNCTNENDF